MDTAKLTRWFEYTTCDGKVNKFRSRKQMIDYILAFEVRNVREIRPSVCDVCQKRFDASRPNMGTYTDRHASCA